jgi:hypothetical protein
MTSAPREERTTVDRLEGVVHVGVDVHSQFQKLKAECTLYRCFIRSAIFVFVGEAAYFTVVSKFLTEDTVQ